MFRDSSTNKLYRVLRSYQPAVRTTPGRGAISPGFWSNGGKSFKEAGFGFENFFQNEPQGKSLTLKNSH